MMNGETPHPPGTQGLDCMTIEALETERALYLGDCRARNNKNIVRDPNASPERGIRRHAAERVQEHSTC